MLGALLYLRLTSLKNWLRSRLLRLKQPKYLVGAIVGAAYMWFFFLRPAGAPSGSRRQAAKQAAMAMQHAGMTAPADMVPAALAIGALILLVVVVLAWTLTTERASLGFSEAEIAFLFPAPVTREALVHFRLIDAQLRSLLGAVFMTLFSNRWTFLPGSPATHAVGWWLVFAAFNLHLAGARFTLTRLSDLGLGTVRRRALLLALLAAVLAATWVRLPEALHAPDFTHGRGPEALTRWIVAVAGGAPLCWVLWLPKALLGPFFADGARSFFFALGPALLVLAVHYFWVVRSVVSFEEGSISRAEKRAATVAAMRAGQRFGHTRTKGRKAPFTLAGTGRPELAFLWKNLLSTSPWFSLRAWVWCALAIVGAATWAGTHPVWREAMLAIGFVPLIFGGYLLLVGPQFARQDIRQDLRNADILKTYPLPGWQIVLGELLAPTAILTGVLWLLLLAAAVSFHPDTARWGALAQEFFSPAARMMLTLGVAAIIPPLVALQLFVPNAAALLFPDMFQATRTRGGGIDVMGQRLIFFAAQFLSMLVLFVPAVLAAGVLGFIARFLGLPAVGVIWLAAASVLVVLLGELWLGLRFLGSRFEKFDLSAELRP